ncbi:homocysteine S-methyltransferase family protein [Desulfobulbus alkaliphilus]|uniref:homocysteine S-methyltransferase family protein n=1 Tax=Desulfobulbus alkaliphilus TaxID=869814 RepID=UPI0019640F47|nr:homocysteine S-methyltransferase family protein [Desulfobulbus alkaliphilus]MBM9538556.1 homocysteine S-methyltransferase family protein [Desulfobulbus alkaliphilus]
MTLAEHPLLIFDGACGTSLQSMAVTEADWAGCDGCNEILNVSAPRHIIQFHQSMLNAGAMVVETNSFGASRIVLAEYGLQERVREINQAAVDNARTAIAGRPNRYIAGSVGPGTKLPSLKHIEVAELAAATAEQIQALLDAGVDCLIIETCQDLLQTKTAVVSALETCERAGVEIPIMVSVTIEQQGTMLVGSDIAAVVATLEPYPLFSLGMNCATGPQDMISHVQYLSQQWSGRISVIPNQGMPQVVDGATCYPLSPADYAEQMYGFVVSHGVSIVGGCCGTSPDHIAALVNRLAGVLPKDREVVV